MPRRNEAEHRLRQSLPYSKWFEFNLMDTKNSVGFVKR